MYQPDPFRTRAPPDPRGAPVLHSLHRQPQALASSGRVVALAFGEAAQRRQTALLAATGRHGQAKRERHQ